ncbi:uncharacterized protein MELLADRAFT_88968 [Melampsora larici-populina 98AG31]|uniref:Uncharacterized protein n=1 Tax=Melampsora larici-populina (strain 98AG31 / pathotype 3-4-7) TaxID=747676 RepID=F4R6G6_MELLP|nr:uncharacterized protein MELLADRAFT_88968 [Melampsora larici-populina 98AG31]EGG11877.1 hypothetical protein MELLADRAFT_88968 [Melampsora larici-populina 98AG31]
MVVETLIHERYQLISNGHLPEPKKGGLVGILCPECRTPLRFHSAKEDAWLIHCPQRPKNRHNWRTWRCDQYNHERALINAGAARPILSTAADWGPRISPSGVILPPKRIDADIDPSLNLPHPIRDDHPFLGRVEQQFMPFANQRTSRGPVARTHRTTGNKGCPHQYCQACCLEYGLGPCPKHPRRDQPAAVVIQTALQLPTASTSTHAPAPPPPARPTPFQLPTPSSSALAPHARPPCLHQWAQSVNSLGHRLGPEAVSAIQIDRRKRYEELERAKADKYDEKKVVTIYLWLDAVEPKVISAHMDQWPKGRLDESPLLIQACTKKFGVSWNRALCIWDGKINTWRETMVNLPHRFPAHPNEIVVRSPNVDPRTPGLPTSKANSSNSTGHYHQGALTPLPPNSSPDSEPDVIVVNGNSTHPLQRLKREVSAQPTKPKSTTVPESNDSGTDDHMDSDSDSDLPEFNPFDDRSHPAEPSQSGTADQAKEIKKGWPSSTILISDLLACFKDCETRPAPEAWNLAFGYEWRYASSTMYRYKKWIEEVEYERFREEYIDSPRANVGAARIRFKEEFKTVANL